MKLFAFAFLSQLLSFGSCASPVHAPASRQICSERSELNSFGAGAQSHDTADDTAPPALVQTSAHHNHNQNQNHNHRGDHHRTAQCQWMVHYDQWQPSFEHHVYRWEESPHDECLQACCHDPNCQCLQLKSSRDSQCYKYHPHQLPDSLVKSEVDARPLGDGKWLAQAPAAWSVFVKVEHSLPVVSGGFVPSARERIREASEAEGLKYAQKAAGAAARTTCDWTVHYGLWTTEFDDGEYEPNNARGGIHCLEACCQDPSCHGLALESVEKYQCYKYSHLPAHLQGGRPFGDGHWLQKLPQKWSVFVKHGVAMVPPVPQLPPLVSAVAPKAAIAVPMAATRPAGEKRAASPAGAAPLTPPFLWPIFVCIAVIVLARLVSSYFSSDAVLKRILAKSWRHGLEGLKPEGRELLQRES